jgi:hypothetical protein
MMRFDMASPKPVPPFLRVVESRHQYRFEKVEQQKQR